MVIPQSSTAPEPMDAPRFTKETFAGCDVNFEARIPEATRKNMVIDSVWDALGRFSNLPDYTSLMEKVSAARERASNSGRRR